MAISGHRFEASLRNYIGRPSSEKLRTCSDIIYDVLSGRPHQSLQRSFKALSSRAMFMFRWFRLLFTHKTHALSNMFPRCHVKKLAFLWVTVWPDFSGHFIFRLETKKLPAKSVSSTCLTIWIINYVNYCRIWPLMVFELWWFDIFENFSLAKPIRLFEIF